MTALAPLQTHCCMFGAKHIIRGWVGLSMRISDEGIKLNHEFMTHAMPFSGPGNVLVWRGLAPGAALGRHRGAAGAVGDPAVHDQVGDEGQLHRAAGEQPHGVHPHQDQHDGRRVSLPASRGGGLFRGRPLLSAGGDEFWNVHALLFHVHLPQSQSPIYFKRVPSFKTDFPFCRSR